MPPFVLTSSYQQFFPPSLSHLSLSLSLSHTHTHTSTHTHTAQSLVHSHAIQLTFQFHNNLSLSHFLTFCHLTPLSFFFTVLHHCLSLCLSFLPLLLPPLSQTQISRTNPIFLSHVQELSLSLAPKLPMHPIQSKEKSPYYCRYLSDILIKRQILSQ